MPFVQHQPFRSVLPISPILSPLPSLLLIAPLTQSLFPSLHLCLAPDSRRSSRLRLVVWLLRRMVVAGLVLVRRRTRLLVGVLRVRTHLGVWCGRGVFRRVWEVGGRIGRVHQLCIAGCSGEGAELRYDRALERAEAEADRRHVW